MRRKVIAGDEGDIPVAAWHSETRPTRHVCKAKEDEEPQHDNLQYVLYNLKSNT